MTAILNPFNYFFMKKVHATIIREYWDVTKDRQKSVQPRVLVAAFGKIALNSDVNKALIMSIKYKMPDFIDNVFTNASFYVLERDILEMAKHLSNSEVFKTMNKHLPRVALPIVVKLAERVPPESGYDLLDIFDKSSNLISVIGGEGDNYMQAKFFADVTKGRDDADAIARLRRSTAWQSIHRTQNFVEVVGSHCNRLLPALH